MISMRKFTQTEVEQYFEDNGCKLVDKYKDARTKMKYICSCGNASSISLDNFKKGKRCQTCANRKSREKLKHSYEYIYNYFKENGCELLSSTYINGKTKLEYRCVCGNISKITFADFQRGKRCWNCKSRKTGDRDRLSFDFVKKEFKVGGCILLSESYINAHQKLEYICECGEKSFITYDKFKAGQRCSKCKLTKLGRFTGEDHWNYDPNKTDEERLLERNYLEYRQWRDEVFERDNYICQVCGMGGHLSAHHLNGYHWAIDQRVDLNNGITLCDTCHDDFHLVYGSYANTKEQFEEYMEGISWNCKGIYKDTNLVI
jgi:uncharacterized phage-like protein YoqJ